MYENARKLKFSKHYRFRLFCLNTKFPIADFVSDRMKNTLHRAQNYSLEASNMIFHSKSGLLFQSAQNLSSYRPKNVLQILLQIVDFLVEMAQ